jgi:uncharacterized protein (DUF427 family)
MDPDRFDPDGRFRADVEASLALDPMATLRTLAANLGLPVEHVVHHALTRWAAAGSEALLAGPPQVFRDLRDAAMEGDLERVRGIVDFLLAGWEEARPSESVWDYPRPPRLERVDRHLRVVLGGTVVAESRRPFRVLETGHPPAYYVPPEEVAAEHLVPSRRRTYCEWKGEASYFTVRVGDREARNAAWYYPRPFAPFAAIADHVAFYPALMDECTLDGEVVRPEPGGFYGGWITREVVDPRGDSWT